MTDCARCGDCCERIGYQGNWTVLQQWAAWAQTWREWAMANLRDGEDGGGDGWMDEGARRQVADADFILTHWTPVPEDAGEAMPRFRCSAFDPVARLCTAHQYRPPICQGYPWYGEAPAGHGHRLPLRCSFWADVPLEERPGGQLRSLPVLH